MAIRFLMLNKIRDLYFPFWLLAFAVLIGLTVPMLIKDGMFMDAVQYTCVSHNLSQGIGTFWFPQFSLRGLYDMSSFHEHPPLVFGIQALFFKILGDSLYTERIYTFLTMCITAYLIYVLWKEACEDETIKKMGWLPVILWITVPVCFWSYSNNMHENTMGIFTLTSGIFVFRALCSQRFKAWQYALAGLFAFLAAFSKGIPGLFTLAMPFIYWLVTRKISFGRMSAATLIMLSIPLLLFGMVLSIPNGQESLSMYFTRLTTRVSSVPTVTTRFDIIGHLFSELLPQLGFVVVVLLATGIKKARAIMKENNNSLTVFFLLVGLAGSLPLMLTMVQKGFYLVPAFPFFIMGLSLLIAPLLKGPISRIDVQGRGYKIVRTITGITLVFVVVFSFMQVGKFNRDEDELHDVYIIGKTVGKYTAVTVPRNTWNEWSLQCYMMRYFNISLDPDENRKYYLIDTQIPADPPAGYSKLDLGLVRYILYIKQ